MKRYWTVYSRMLSKGEWFEERCYSADEASKSYDAKIRVGRLAFAVETTHVVTIGPNQPTTENVLNSVSL